MNHPTSLILTLAGLLLLAGCTPNTPETAIPKPQISDVVFVQGEFDTVEITGDYFKIKSDSKMDVVASLNGRNWFAAKKVLDSSPTKYKVVLPYGVDFPQVWVRIFGVDEEYSDPALAHVRRH